MNLTQKILKKHLISGELKEGEEIGIRIDQVLVQDLTGTQVLLHFESGGFAQIGCEVAVCYADHNVIQVKSENMQDHVYLQTAGKKYGMWYAKPGAGIGHQIHQEHFAIPGKTALGADSHTPHCGGIGMIAIGAGGLDVAVAMAGGPYCLVMPRVVHVVLKGQLQPWVTAKDVILEMLRTVTVRGGKGRVFEYSGEGIKSLNAQERCTITNMGAELGATTSIFPSDEVTREYFRLIERENDWVEEQPDADATYDERIELDLSRLEPLIALPSQPDNVVPVRKVFGTKIEQVLVGSCTNGSYIDLQSIAKMVKGRRIHPDVNFVIHPSSRSDLEVLAREGLYAEMVAAGINIAEATCGACIGTGHVPAPGTKSLRAINRNFKGRSGLADDQVYLASSETAAATAIKGVITDPRDLGIPFPGVNLPPYFSQDNPNLVPPASLEEAPRVQVVRGANIVPTPPKSGTLIDAKGEILIKLGDDISTDHIMPASADILAYRSNVPKISEFVFFRIDPEFSARAREKGGGFIVGGNNYGQGSSREHAAIAPMFLGVIGVIAKSFARIHHSNLINFGLLPLEFVSNDDYDKLDPGDVLSISNVPAAVDSLSVLVENVTKGFSFKTKISCTPRQQNLLKHGGLMQMVRAKKF
jgi:aconitate hydratase